MQGKTLLPWLAVVAILFALLTPAGPIYACTPPPGGLQRYTVTEHVAAAEIVLEGTVTAVDGQPPQTATITVHQYLKGSGPATVTMGNFGPSSVCRSEVSVGDHLLFYASGDPAGDLQAFYLSQFDATAPADPQTISEAIVAAGQEPFIPVQPEQNAGIPTPAIAPTPMSSTYVAIPFAIPLLGACCLGLLLLILVAAVFWRNRSQG